MEIYLDSAALDDIEAWASDPLIAGFTTNPTLMRTAGVTDPMVWAKRAVEAAAGKPISIDGPSKVWKLGPNVWRKVPLTSSPDIRKFDGRTNVTAICSINQLDRVTAGRSAIFSVFAGRILDTGRDPQRVINAAKATGARVLWASVREPYHMVMAEEASCDIITVPPAILRKWRDWQDKPLDVVAEETIAQFHADAAAW